MELPSSPQGSPTWQQQLLEAVRQRDGVLAASLAQRCVHRYGMHTLETLLAQAHAHDGPSDDSRDWLLSQLLQAPPAPAMEAPAPLPPPAAPSSAPMPISVEASHVPVAPPSPSRLDEAFAPLEIAFPPLPSVNGDVPPGPPAPSALLAEQETGVSLRIESDLPLPTPGEIPDQPEAFQAPPDYEAGKAAPIPTFERQEATADLPPSRREHGSGRSRTRRLSPAPIPPALERWLVFFPGALRRRDR